MDQPKNEKRETLVSAASDAQRTVDEVQQLLEKATPDDLLERATAVNEKLEQARSALKRAAADAENVLGPVLQNVEREFTEEIEAIEQRVRENPLGALLGAAGIGLLLGIALSRKR